MTLLDGFPSKGGTLPKGFFIYKKARSSNELETGRKRVKFMQNQNKKMLELIPTNRPNEYSVRLNLPFRPLFIGRLNTSEGKFVCRKTEEKHFHRNSDSIAINEELLTKPPVKFFWIEVEFVKRDGRKSIYTTSREYFLANGTAFKYKGYERQVGLPLTLWGKERALEFHRMKNAQANLFSGEAA